MDFDSFRLIYHAFLNLLGAEILISDCINILEKQQQEVCYFSFFILRNLYMIGN